MGGYPSAATSRSRSSSPNMGERLSNNSFPRPSSSMQMARSDPNFKRNDISPSQAKHLATSLDNGGGDKTDIFALDPDGLYSSGKQPSSISIPTTSVPSTVSISVDGQQPLNFSKNNHRPLIQKDESFSSSPGSSNRGRTIIIEESKNFPDPNQNSSGLMAMPLIHSNSVRMKKKTASVDIDSILNMAPSSSLMNKKEMQDLPLKKKKEKVDSIRPSLSFNDKDKNTPEKTAKPAVKSRMSLEMDSFIDAILKKQGKGELPKDEKQINDFHETNLPMILESDPILYHKQDTYLEKRRKSTVAMEQDEEQEAVIRRTYSSFNPKRTQKTQDDDQENCLSIEPKIRAKASPMIVVSGGQKTLQKDKSLYTIGGVISDKKKTELEKRRKKRINRDRQVGKIGPLITIDSDSEEEEEDMDTQSQYELETEYGED